MTVARPIAPPPSFYEPHPAQLPGPPGSLIDALELDAPAGLRGWAVLYRSTGTRGEPIGVSGLVLAADRPARPGGAPRPVIAWAHGTTGIADACAPSRQGIEGGLGVPQFVDAARLGFVVTATDYEGLGTPGIHPYLVGPSEGRSVLDSIRAATALEPSAARGAIGIIGISQGGHAALWAGELLAAHAPELDVKGIVAASPPIDLRAVQQAVVDGRRIVEIDGVSWLEALMVATAWHDVHGAPLAGLLTAEAEAIAEALRTECPWLIGAPTETPFLEDPRNLPEWQDLLAANSPGASGVPIRAPVLVVAATQDEQVHPSTIEPSVAALRGMGSDVELRWVEGGHTSTLTDPAAAAMVLAWLLTRLGGLPA